MRISNTWWPLLAAMWALAGLGQPAVGSEGPQGPAASLPATEANSTWQARYWSAGLALLREQDTRFVDGENSGHAALYGGKDTFDTGAIDDGLQFHLSAGTRLSHRLRAQLELDLARDLDWRGNANYSNSGQHQPSEARLDTWQLLLAGYYDFQGWDLAPGVRIQPFLGAGLGVTDYRLDRYVQHFPEPDNPQGYLRKGSDGEIPHTALPGGSGREFTWMLSAGMAIPVNSNLHLDLSYRYTDAGEIHTDTGDIDIVRYREDGTRRDIQVPINRTSADYQTRAWLAALRFKF